MNAWWIRPTPYRGGSQILSASVDIVALWTGVIIPTPVTVAALDDKTILGQKAGTLTVGAPTLGGGLLQ